MNKQQIIDRLLSASEQSSVDGVRSSIFLLLSDLCKEEFTLSESYNLRSFPNKIRTEVILENHFTCVYCGRVGNIDLDPDGALWEVDHVIPYSKGGPTCLDNAVLSCAFCNSEKGNRTPFQYIRKLRHMPVISRPTNNDEYLTGECSVKSSPQRLPWRSWIIEYAEQNTGVLQFPPVGIRRLARAMSAHETGSEENANRYTGIASETCQYLRENLVHSSK